MQFCWSTQWVGEECCWLLLLFYYCPWYLSLFHEKREQNSQYIVKVFSLSNWNYGIMKKVNFIYEVNKVETLHFLLQRKWIVWKKRRRCHDDNNEWKKNIFLSKNVVFWRKRFSLFCERKTEKKRNIFPEDFWTVIRSFSMFQVSFFQIISFDCIIDTCLTLTFCFCQFGIFCFSLPK